MTTYEFTALPGSSAVASLVTLLASAWFVLAGGAILTDHHSERTVENARTPALTMAALPDYHVRAADTASGMQITATRSTL